MRDGVATKTDLIKQLNTRMLTGNSPDLLILDGLSAENHIEKEFRVNLEQILSEENCNKELFSMVI